MDFKIDELLSDKKDVNWEFRRFESSSFQKILVFFVEIFSQALFDFLFWSILLGRKLWRVWIHFGLFSGFYFLFEF